MQEEIGTNVPTSITDCNALENQEKRPNQPLTDDKGRFRAGTSPGPGRSIKYAPAPEPPKPHSTAMQFARIAISQLSRITDDDPKKFEALSMVKNWINNNLLNDEK
jgi:hypothetical protein